MADERSMRTCSKTACRWPAAASLSYRYDTRQAWLIDLSEEPDPSLYDLCPHHADTLVVMRGWSQVDQRTHAEPVVEPAGRDLLPDSGHPPVGPGGYGGNRYSALVEDLPRLAAEVAGAGDPDTDTQAGDAPSASAMAAAAPVVAVAVRPSRDLAPIPPPEPAPVARPAVPEAPPIPAPTSVHTGASQVPGQLVMPVPDEDVGAGEAIVVSITSASGRRRATADR